MKGRRRQASDSVGARSRDKSGIGVGSHSSDEGDENMWIGRRDRIWMEGGRFGPSDVYVTSYDNCWTLQ
jgi:hypothetical protein